MICYGCRVAADWAKDHVKEFDCDFPSTCPCMCRKDAKILKVDRKFEAVEK